MTAQPGGFAADDLRALVREVLLEALPGAHRTEPAAPPADPADPADVRWVVVGGDDDLDELVRTVARECADPERREELATGSVRYRLAPGPDQPDQPDMPDEAGEVDEGEETGGPVLRVERGAVTERHVREASRTGARIVAARGAVLTPLARDRARSSGVDIEKEY